MLIPAALKDCPRLRFVIVGGSTAEIEARRREMETAGAADRVAFAGTIAPEAVPNLLRASDLLLSPRLSGKNTPLKLLDYLKSGRAIVATDTTANRLILSDATAHFTAPDPEAYGRGIADAAADAELRERLGREGRALAQREYGFEAFRRGLADCYAALPVRRRSGRALAGAVALAGFIGARELAACLEWFAFAI